MASDAVTTSCAVCRAQDEASSEAAAAHVLVAVLCLGAKRVTASLCDRHSSEVDTKSRAIFDLAAQVAKQAFDDPPPPRPYPVDASASEGKPRGEDYRSPARKGKRK